MRLAIMTTVALIAACPVRAQTTVPPQAPPVVTVLPPITTPPADLTVLGGATVVPDCGGLYGLQGRAFCVSALLTEMGTLAAAYVEDAKSKGWLVAAGDDNRVVFVRRKADGDCDGLQMQAFYDTSVAATPTTLAYLGFGVVPGNICADPAPVGTPPQ